MASAESRLSATPSDLVDVKRTRPRADSEEVDLPRPESSRHFYTVERIQQGVKYVDRRLSSTTRKSSPNLSKMLVIYRAACQAYLSEPENGTGGLSKTSLLDEIRGYEEYMVNDSWFRDADDEETHRFKESFLTLRRCQYFARYGDYARRLANELRLQAFKDKIEGWRQFSGEDTWKEISDQLGHEESFWNKEHNPVKDLTKYPTIRTVYLTCQSLGIDYDLMKAAIHTYGDRNEALHNNIDTILKNGKFQQLAEMISSDLNDLSSIIPLDLQHEEALLRAILLDLKKRWFQIPEDDMIEPPPDEWYPSEEIKAEIKDRRDPGKKDAAVAKHQNGVLLGSIKLLQRTYRDNELINQLLANLQPSVLPQPGPQPIQTGKRRATSHLSPVERKKLWRCISDHQVRDCDRFNSSLAMQIQVNKCTSDYRANFGSSF